MPCLQKNGAVTPQYRQRLCPAAQGRFFHAIFAQLAEQLSPKNTGRWFESARMKTQTFCKQKTASVSLRWRSFYGRGWITQAAHLKKPRRGFFPRRTVRRVDAVRIHPPSLWEGYYKTKLQYPVRILEFLVGAGGFEPPKLKSSRFTVCPHWPLGNTPIFYLQSSLTACIFYHLKWHLSTTFSTDFLFFCRSLFFCVLPQ